MFTKLEAVNLLLDAIGESAVSSLSSGLPDAEKAERFLDRTSKQIQAKGWHCNRDENLLLPRDENNRIPIAGTYLRVDTTGVDRSRNVTVRDLGGAKFLYDVKNQTFLFTKNLKGDVVWHFEFETLTAELRAYIAWKAAEQFQQSEMASVALDVFIKEGVRDAWAALQDAEAESEDANVLTDSPSMAFTTYRNNRLYGA